MSSPPKLNKDGTIKLEYKNGGSCETDGNNISTTVYLKCPDTEVSMHVHLHVCTRISLCTCMYIYMYMYVYLYVHVCISICTCMYIYMYMYMYVYSICYSINLYM